MIAVENIVDMTGQTVSRFSASQNKSLSTKNVLESIDHGVLDHYKTIDHLRDDETGYLTYSGGDNACIKGFVASLEVTSTKKGDRMAAGKISDGETEIDFIAYPRTFVEIGDRLKYGAIAFFAGKLGHGDEIVLNLDSMYTNFKITLV